MYLDGDCVGGEGIYKGVGEGCDGVFYGTVGWGVTDLYEIDCFAYKVVSIKVWIKESEPTITYTMTFTITYSYLY